jgi:hypothetical protein
MSHQPIARFHQPLLQARQRPVLDPLPYSIYELLQWSEKL